MAIDWAAETVYWIERAKEYAKKAGVSQAEIDSMERCKKTPRKESRGQRSVMEKALGMSLENLSEQALEKAHGRASSLLEDFLTLDTGEKELCCDDPKCPVRAIIIKHNQQLKAELN